MMRQAQDDLRRARVDNIERLAGIGVAIEIIFDAVESEVIMGKMPGHVKAELAVVPDRPEPIFL
ncbi:MAG: hypothetical protein ABSF08_03895 [Candidatus Cybelea sp.]